MPLQLNIKSRPTCFLLVGHFFARLTVAEGNKQAKKPPRGATVGKVSLHHPDDKLSMRVQACIDGSQYASQSGSDYVSSAVFCDKVWQVPAWPNSPYFVMLPL